MNKAFTRESEDDDDGDGEVDAGASLAPGQKNYLTPGGYSRLKSELDRLVDKERPEVVGIVSWAAGNGDRSENGDYIYGKKRLREIDRRIRFLVKRLDLAEVVDPAGRDIDQIYFGATVDTVNQRGESRTVSIVGIDETDTARGYISWISPMGARAAQGARRRHCHADDAGRDPRKSKCSTFATKRWLPATLPSALPQNPRPFRRDG
jgi:transcription elongation factor GreB